MMDCTAATRLASQWAAGDLPTTEELREFERHVAGCPSCRAAYAAIAPLIARDADPGAAAPGSLPDALADRIMGAVHREPSHHATVARPRPRLQLRAAAAVAAVLLVAAGVALGIELRSRAEDPYLTVTFVLDEPTARTVALAGDFTSWQTAGYQLAKRPSDGTWAITIRLRRDRSYTYCFVVDGEQWVPDPRSPETVEDGFGGVNSVLQL